MGYASRLLCAMIADPAVGHISFVHFSIATAAVIAGAVTTTTTTTTVVSICGNMEDLLPCIGNANGHGCNYAKTLG